MSKIYGASKEEGGYPPHYPRMMVTIRVYAYASVRTFRKIASALHEDVAFRVLANKQQPSDPSLTLYFGKSINRPAKRANHSGMIERA